MEQHFLIFQGDRLMDLPLKQGATFSLLEGPEAGRLS